MTGAPLFIYYHDEFDTIISMSGLLNQEILHEVLETLRRLLRAQMYQTLSRMKVVGASYHDTEKIHRCSAFHRLLKTRQYFHNHRDKKNGKG